MDRQGKSGGPACATNKVLRVFGGSKTASSTHLLVFFHLFIFIQILGDFLITKHLDDADKSRDRCGNCA